MGRRKDFVIMDVCLSQQVTAGYRMCVIQRFVSFVGLMTEVRVYNYVAGSCV